MSDDAHNTLRVAIACGGTGGHLFPGLAVAQELMRRRCAVTLLVSQKEIDQTATRGLTNVEILTLPAVGLSRGNVLAFLAGFVRAYRAARRHFTVRAPHAALAMGGFTSAPPLLAARRIGARSFLHESNTIPGRANRWLSWGTGCAFVGFPETASRLHTRQVMVTGTPVRPQFKPRDSAASRWALGLDPVRPTLLVMGGSQGASGINRLVIQSLPALAQVAPELQYVHLCGSADFDAVKQTYAGLQLRAAVHPFFHEMEIAMGAATVAVTRAGASSLAELAAMRLPPILIPYPAATDNHQWHNARAFEESGAAFLLPQRDADPEKLSSLILQVIQNPASRAVMQRALEAWHRPQAAEQIAENMLGVLTGTSAQTQLHTSPFQGTAPHPSPGNELQADQDRNQEVAA